MFVVDRGCGRRRQSGKAKGICWRNCGSFATGAAMSRSMDRPVRMSRQQFAGIMAYMKTACHASEVTSNQAEIYFDLLCDLPYEVVLAASKLAVLSHPYPSLPPVSSIRRHAVSLCRPVRSADEAWQMFGRAVSRYGCGKGRRKRNGEWVEFDRSEDGLKSLPSDVAEAARRFGWQRLCDTPSEYMALAQRDFVAIYRQVESQAVERLSMPSDVRSLVESIGRLESGGAVAMLPEAGDAVHETGGN